jgi:hypothetical protein
MNKTEPIEEESTSVDDVRRVREKIASQYGGDFRRQCEDTNRIFEQWREKLRVKSVPVIDDRSPSARS